MSDIWWDSAVGRAVSGEADTIIRHMNSGVIKPPLIFCHEHQANTISVVGRDYYRGLLMALAEDYSVIVSDLGYISGQQDRWGDSVHVTRVGQARAALAAIGSTGPVTFVTCSHGNLGAMNYMLQQGASQIAAIAAITPAMSLNSLRQVNGGAYAAAINSRYDGNYSDSTHGLTSSPHIYRALYPPVPTAIFTAPNDTITLNQWVDDFVAAKPEVKRYNLGGSLDHGEAAIQAAIPGVIDWIRGNRNKT